MTEPIQAKSNQHINNFLEDYIALEHGPSYAVLIKGSWGVGKTEFIKKFVAETNRQNIYYMSLFGKTAVDEITQVAYEKKHPIQSKLNNMANVANGNKDQVASTFASLSESVAGLDCLPETITDPAKKLTEKVASGFLSVFSKVTNMVTDRAKDSLFDNTSILIFDDLERCLIDQQALFGWLHDKVDLCRCKVILLANEQKILTKTNEESQERFSYTEIKEKLIGVSFELQSCVDDATMSFIAEIKKNKPKGNNEELTEIFEHLNDLFMHCKDNLLFKNLCEAPSNPIQVTKTNQPNESVPDDTNTHNPFSNLRLIRMAMYGFARIYQNINKKFHAESHRNHLEKVFKLYLCGYIEEQSGSRSKNHKSLNTYLAQVINDYTQEYQGMADFIAPMCDAILHEKINAQTWNDALETFTTPPAKQPLWKQLSNWQKLDQTKLDDVYAKLWCAFQNQDMIILPCFGDLLASVFILLDLDQKSLKLTKRNELIKHANNMLNKLGKEIDPKYHYSFDRKMNEAFDMPSFRGIILSGLEESHNKLFNDFDQATISKEGETKKQTFRNQAKKIFEQFWDEPKKTIEELTLFCLENKKIDCLYLMHQLTSEEFINRFKLIANNIQFEIVRSLANSAKENQTHVLFDQDGEWLKTLKETLQPDIDRIRQQKTEKNNLSLTDYYLEILYKKIFEDPCYE